MADVKWIKVATDIFDNRKIKQIEIMPEGDSIIVIWIKLLCLAGSINDRGQIYLTQEIPYTDQMLATQFGRPLPIVKLALKVYTGKKYKPVTVTTNSKGIAKYSISSLGK